MASHEVLIDGVRYVPATGDRTPGRIGIGVTTRNRREVFAETIEHIRKFAPDGAAIVVVDDASDDPVPDATYRFLRQAGIARAKNKCLELLADAGCEHLFLFDDDCYPIADGWWRPYVESDEPHLMYAWGDEYFRTDKLVGYLWPKGCMLYVERRVLERVGGLDPIFGVWGLEHMSWSDRIHNAGFTTCRYQDVPGSEKLFLSKDREQPDFPSSVPLETRLIANVRAAERYRDSDAFVPYRDTPADRDRVALSILVPSVASRRSSFLPKIMDELYGQHEALPPEDRRRVEILVLTDAEGLDVGTKRNKMVALAEGEYVAFVDDDDRLAPDYLRSLLDATAYGTDVITFRAEVRVNGGRPKPCIYSAEWDADENTEVEFRRIPNHLAAVRRELALRTPFPRLNRSEDSSYAKQLKPLLQSEHHIPRILYYYDYNSETTVAQRRSDIERVQKPVVDVVILSKASTDELREMTERTIETCLSGAGGYPINIIVLEQEPGIRYRNAITIHRPGKFAYNKFANEGIRTGSAPWILVANSDLEFGDGWLEPLLKTKHPLMSPVSSTEPRQARLTRSEAGYENGKHFSGWCFMISRELWEKFGGLDEDFIFWCADDSVIEQAKRHGIRPLVVPASKVKHLISRTVGGRGHRADDPMDGDLTWAMVELFNAKYGANKFLNDQRYIQWRKANPEKVREIRERFSDG